MRTIQIEEDIYQFILRSAEEIEESASSILRRLLGLSRSVSKNGGEATQSATQPPEDPASKALLEFVSGAEFRLKRTATDKYLAILSFLYRTRRDEFATVSDVSGRRRKYFAGTRDEIAESGTSTHPRKIPESPYWALTNADTYHKREILRQVLVALGYDHATALQVTKVLR